MNIGLLNFKTGNLKSIIQTFKKLFINVNIYIINKNFKKFNLIDKLIIPGQGSNVTIIKNILFFKFEELKNLFLNKHILGICVGKQFFFKNTEEFNCFGNNFFNGLIKKFSNNNKFFKNPHIGWNKVFFLKNHQLLKNLKNNSLFYFSHSFYLLSNDNKNIFGLTKYKLFFPSIFIKNNIFLMQFHPEKSLVQGLKIFYNFLNWNI